ncbi:MAG: DUF6571 family protein, partial [Myxococcota bacterium]
MARFVKAVKARGSGLGGAVKRSKDDGDSKSVSTKIKTIKERSASAKEVTDHVRTVRDRSKSAEKVTDTASGSLMRSQAASEVVERVRDARDASPGSSTFESVVRPTLASSQAFLTRARAETSSSNQLAWRLQNTVSPADFRGVNGAANAGRLGALSQVVFTGASSSASPADAGAADAEELIHLTDVPPQQLSDADLQRIDEINQNLEMYAEDEAYAAAFFDTLGPERAARLPSDLASIAQVRDYGTDGDLDIDYTAMGGNLSVALGTASRSGELSSDYADRLRRSAGPTTEAIYLSKGTFEPEFVADLADDVFRYHDPNLAPADQAFEVPGGHSPELGGYLFGFEEASFDQSTF